MKRITHDVSADGFRVVRIIRFAADEVIYPTATAASEAQHRLAMEHPDREYAIAHTTYPLEADHPTERKS